MENNRLETLLVTAISALDSIIQAYDKKSLTNSVLVQESKNIKAQLDSSSKGIAGLMDNMTMDRITLMKLSGSFAHQVNIIISALTMGDETMKEVAIDVARTRMNEFLQDIKNKNQGMLPSKALQALWQRYKTDVS
ncbi:hypothetical protein JQC92_16875 [Shewanella sp. 202IG2-18]|uniref:hypothetical protein n=1 Tax=Parashewanella hymeniacidonis TaxID=2807618 RepID=UPI00195FCDEC|nr:hypothetical protein [Parashewanella hymeniacidonis]MBM7073685.1 hypothetical protein [Parashewanella hymeniacidonis]